MQNKYQLTIKNNIPLSPHARIISIVFKFLKSKETPKITALKYILSQFIFGLDHYLST